MIDIVPVFGGPGLGTDVAGMLERVLQIAPVARQTQAELLMRHAVAVCVERADDTGARQAVKRALEIARQQGDARLEVKVLRHGLTVSLQGFRWQGLANEAAALADRAHHMGDRYSEVRSRFVAACAFSISGESDDAWKQCSLEIEGAEEMKEVNILENALLQRIGLASLGGDWKIHRETVARLLELNPRLTSDTFRYVEAATEGAAGCRDAIEDTVRKIESSTQPRAFIYDLDGLLTVCEYEPDERWLLAAVKVTEDFLASPYTSEMRRAMATLTSALIAVLRRDASSAADIYQRLSAFGHVVQYFGEGTCSARVLGRLAALTNDRDSACRHFDEALAFCRKAGYRPELARVLVDYAAVVLEGERATDRERAVALQDEAISIARELSMQLLLERVLASRKFLKA
jgi:hypothetical protein